MSRTKVYIAGPYSKGDVAVNVKNAMEVATELMDLGYAPFCPHLTHFLHINNPRPYEMWLAIDDEFVKVCDALVRIPGESNGADKEVKLAEEYDVPVYYSVEDLHKNHHVDITGPR